VTTLDPTVVRLRSEDLAPPPDPIGRGHVCEPRLAALGDGTILLSYRGGSGRLTVDGRVGLLRSGDGGRSWDWLGTPFPSQWAGRDGDQLLALLAPVGARGVLAWVAWMDRGDARPWRNRATEGRLPLRILQAESADGGTTWGTVREISVAPLEQAVPQCMLALADGSILATFETFKHYDDTSPWHYEAGAVRTQDGGQTWSVPTVAAEVDPTGRMWWDPRCVQLADGRLMQYYHAFDYPIGRDADVHVASSADGGQSWTEPAGTGITGQVSWPVLVGGAQVLVQQRRHTPAGIVALVCEEDGGMQQGSELEVYAHEGLTIGAADGSIPAAAYFDDMDGFTFGHPSAVPLADGSALLAYYVGRRGDTGLRLCRLTVEGGGGST
jgi:sialidase-1